MRIIRDLTVGAMAAGLAGMLATTASAESWDLPTPYPDTNFHTKNIRQFAEDVKEATGGKLEITVHGGGALIKHAEIKNAVRQNTVPIGEFFLSRLANENAIFEVDSAPFLATNYEDAKKLWDVSRPTIEEALKKQRMMVLFSVPWPPQGLYTKKDINAVSDLAGVKFRAYNKATERLAQLADAVPTQVEVPDIPQAFATGRVEAMITSPSTGADGQAWDYLTHFYHTQAWLPKNIVVVNVKAFNGLDEDVQNAVLEAAAKAEERGWQMSREETEAKIQILKDNGIKVAEPNPELKAELAKLGEQMAGEWAERAGDAGKAILEAYRN